MIANYLKNIKKEIVAEASRLSSISEQRVPYLIYKQYYYAYITPEDCFVTRAKVTYPELTSILSLLKEQGVEGEVWTIDETEELVELIEEAEEANDVPVEETLIEEIPEEESTVVQGEYLETDLSKGTVALTNEGLQVEEGNFYVEEPIIGTEDKQVDESNEPFQKKYSHKRKKNRA